MPRPLRTAFTPIRTAAGFAAAAGLAATALAAAALAAAALAAAALLAGCTATTTAPAHPGRLQVTAAESFWGRLAGQLGGARVSVQSLIANPDTDPHAYEPTARDGIALARARLAIVNGIGYDLWAAKLLAANSGDAGRVLDVGRLLGLHQGANPHQWYSPASVRRVIDSITADYERLDPAGAAYYERRHTTVLTRGLAEYDRLIAEIRARYAGVPVGYSESIFEPLGRALGLRLMTPASFAKAIAEGTDPSAADVQTVDAQAQQRRIAVWVYNRQNATPDVARVNAIARSAQVPVATVTETLSPAGDSFEQWQVAQLRSLELALAEARGR